MPKKERETIEVKKRNRQRHRERLRGRERYIEGEGEREEIVYRTVRQEIYAGPSTLPSRPNEAQEINSLIERRVSTVTYDGMPEFTTDITHSSLFNTHTRTHQHTHARTCVLPLYTHTHSLSLALSTSVLTNKR